MLRLPRFLPAVFGLALILPWSAAGPAVGLAVLSFPEGETSGVITASTLITPGDLGAGRHQVYWDLGQVAGGDAPALSVSDAHVLPDLTTGSAWIEFGREPGNTDPLSPVIFNDGNAASPAAQAAA